MKKTVILPILAVLQLILSTFGMSIPEETINQTADAIANIIAVAFVIYGIFKDHKKKEGDEK